MRIVQYSPVYLPYLSGTSRVVHSHARILHEAGHAVSVCAPQKELIKEKGIGSVRALSLASVGNASWSFLPSSVFPCDVIQLHYPFFWGAGSALRSLASGDARALAVYYHFDHAVSGILRGTAAQWYERKMLPALLDRASIIMVSSREYAEHSRNADLLARVSGKTHIVPIGIEPERFPKSFMSVSDLCRRFPQIRPPFALFVGKMDRAHYFKGVNVLLDAWRIAKINGFQLVLAGEGDLRTQYQRIALRHGLGNRAAFIGRVSDKELMSLYRACAVFVFPSVNAAEAFGIVALEASSCGASIIASDLPGIRAAVGDASVVWVPPGDSGALASAMRKTLCAEDGINGHGRHPSLRDFSPTVSYERMKEALLLAYGKIGI